ncbi:hypothetical protein [Streptomyces tsukubensis]|uniref:Uncharacterized protein n=1 Tax=Streptomyces tsukubensis (strain DSM 42081 / NBRC 108919 / NRRL 18488 / 9993) TaxID=1114943 RepID=A0A7G3UF05_STRT9|nr:hypothetical protein [Streptomyces tsukubensis]AZK94914.1 hypothetical protein B7R87_14335 [Streptomyces tsukubensis]QKM69007.1 hypothetical protein STSU_019440 [Streptomyces tsukubensis NRRL18488]TAI40774.1 hypothetical protein EWI31_30800 [Streptomyces tsukubensis]
MAITDDLRELRKNLSDPTPLYFAAGTADLAVQQALKVPALLEQLAAEAPERIEGIRSDLNELRNTDPKAVQERVTGQAKEAQATVSAKVNEVFAGLGGLDGDDLKKLGETAQDLALRGVGVAAEYAVKARETYERVAEHGEQTVRTWRGEAAEEITEIAVAVEPEPAPAPRSAPASAPKREPKTAAKARTRAAKPAAGAAGNKAAAGTEPKAEPKAAAKKTPAPRRAPAARRTAAKKTNPPAK